MCSADANEVVDLHISSWGLAWCANHKATTIHTQAYPYVQLRAITLSRYACLLPCSLAASLYFFVSAC